MGQLIGAPGLKAPTPSNIMAGFPAAGIWQFNRNVFSDNNFLPSFLTNRPNPNAQENPQDVILPMETQPGPSRETNDDQHSFCREETGFITTEIIRSYPKVIMKQGTHLTKSLVLQVILS